LILAAVAAVAAAGEAPHTLAGQAAPVLAGQVVPVLAGQVVPVSAGQAAPRTSPEFVVAGLGQPNVALSSFKGKVVVMELLFASSAHCVRVAQTLNKLRGELGSQGFQPLAVVFDPPNTRTSGEQLIPVMRDYFKLTFPVGFAAKAAVDSYLGRAPAQILN